jgi:hypothetical protein
MRPLPHQVVAEPFVLSGLGQCGLDTSAVGRVYIIKYSLPYGVGLT